MQGSGNKYKSRGNPKPKKCEQISEQLKPTISNVVYLVPISYKLRFTENNIFIQMVHTQLVIKIKLLRSEQGCLFSYPLCLVQIHSSNYMNRLTQISVFKNLIIEH